MYLKQFFREEKDPMQVQVGVQPQNIDAQANQNNHGNRDGSLKTACPKIVCALGTVTVITGAILWSKGDHSTAMKVAGQALTIIGVAVMCYITGCVCGVALINLRDRFWEEDAQIARGLDQAANQVLNQPLNNPPNQANPANLAVNANPRPNVN